jgi:2-keto-4-pentenoate hydratase
VLCGEPVTATMTPASSRAAHEVLVGHWTAGTTLESLPDPLRPMTRADGYAIQALLEEWTTSPLYGWKIAATSAAGQAHIAVDQPLAGRILAERVVADGGTCPFGNNRMRVAELEFAFTMAATLPPRPDDYTVDDVLAAVATLHPAIEVPDSRFAHFESSGAPQLIADDACAHYFVLGEPAPSRWRDLDLARYSVTGDVGGGPPRVGNGGNVLGDPRVALAWLANELSHHGVALRAGQVVTTGTCLVPMPIAPGDVLRGDFGELGSVCVTMEDG